MDLAFFLLLGLGLIGDIATVYAEAMAIVRGLITPISLDANIVVDAVRGLSSLISQN